MKKILLLTPPFTQLNAPYPATAFLKGTLEKYQKSCDQFDLGIKVIRKLFSEEGLADLAEYAIQKEIELPFIFNKYKDTIDSVICFLVGGNPGLAYQIVGRNYLPEGKRFEILNEMELDFNNLAITDGAKYLCGLYLDDLTELIGQTILPEFQLSRYKDRIAQSQPDFQLIEREVLNKGYLTKLFYNELDKLNLEDYQLVAITIPFPGNLVSSLQIAANLKLKKTGLKIAVGGGYVNTELRDISDSGIFKFIDYLVFDDGEEPLIRIIDHLEGKNTELLRTKSLDKDKVIGNPDEKGSFKIDDLGDPDYEGIDFDDYFTLYETPNAMQRLWSERGFFKLRMAHGCYWHRCTFCDLNLDYVKNFWQLSAKRLVDQVRKGIRQTGVTGVHFVDEAMPPALVKSFSLELLKQNIKIQWWGNLRLDKGFTFGLCNLMQKAGCIAAVAGLEAVTDRMMEKIDKGVNVKQAAEVCQNFKANNIFLHTYLIYGIPGQTVQDLVDSIEILRQFFQANLIDSVYWHRFALTIHSQIFKDAESYKIKPEYQQKSFGNNDINYEDLNGVDLDSYAFTLRKAVYNFSFGLGLDFPVWEWFEVKVPKPTIQRFQIKCFLKDAKRKRYYNLKKSSVHWLGGSIKSLKKLKAGKGVFVRVCQIEGFNRNLEWELPEALYLFLREMFAKCSLDAVKLYSLEYFKPKFPKGIGLSFDDFLYNEIFEELVENGLVIL